MNTLKVTVCLVGLMACAACGEDDGLPTEVGPGELTILRQAATAPPLALYSASFWAVKGTSRTLEIDYAPIPPNQSGEDFFRLDVPSNALFIGPDGELVQPGDSVLISVTIDPVLLLVRFEPSGLRFDPGEPARLRIDYAEADDDLNGDGRVDGQDEQLKDLRLALWRQAQAGAVWERIGSAHFKDLEEFEAELLRFSNYALGW